MNSSNEHINLIIKYLNNEISDTQNSILTNWIQENSANEKLFNDYKTIWELTQTKLDKEVAEIDIEEELQFIRNKIGFNTPKVVDFKPKTKSNLWKYSVAAAIVLLIGLFLIFNKKTIEISSESTVVTATLPDNTQITLNRNSSIKYPKNFDKNRTITLYGDAYFIVEHNDESSLKIVANNYIIEDIGTEFFVSVTDSNFQVVVNSGVVKIYSTDNSIDTVILNAGQQFDNQHIISQITSQNYLAWKTRKIEFNNQTLQEICEILSKTYGFKIEISNNDLKNLRMTSTFDNQPIESVFEVIKATLNIKITKQGDKYIIYK